MTKEEMSKLHRGDIVQSSDGTIVKIHHFDANGRVFYEAFVRIECSTNVKIQNIKIQHNSYKCFYGFANECSLATEDQKAFFEKSVSDFKTWIRENDRKDR